ncbi:hypothetical protein [uncultured Streptococcus sp.]|uniref:hypothetical protein n=1 Tax=uncultured Streptococcus sp. TaxID=83427 RepID=UPI00259A9718|nr:hypothetical protein [uncultured Streptococcus sp.]
MQLFKFSFEESGYIVDEAFVKRSMEKSINKRFLGLFIIAFLDYFFNGGAKTVSSWFG